MTIFFHNSLSGKREIFTPAKPDRVSVYVCGPTVYSYAHIGNARAAVVFDQLFRLLRAVYGAEKVVYARNITDIDDKIIAAAREADVPIGDITKKFTKIYREDMGALGVLPPTIEPHATDHIEAMQVMISGLLSRGHAYAREGHVLFDVETYKAYGQLSKISQDEMIAGARVEIAPYKKNPADFVLWKPAKEGEPGWSVPSDWGIEGTGRPGWHLECSAMIEKVFEGPIDIHGGGQDLRFPHHENEIAQSCCAGGGCDEAPLARFWLHNGFLNMGDDKMSKSLGNIVLPRDLLKKWDGETIRWALLSAHYRQPLIWTQKILEQSKKQLDRFYRLMEKFPYSNEAPMEPPQKVIEALSDDLNTPSAMAVLHALRDKAANGDREALSQLRSGGQLLGVLQQNPADWFRRGAQGTGLSDEAIEALLQERRLAKSKKDYGKADAIRETLAEANILIEDGPQGTKWRRG